MGVLCVSLKRRREMKMFKMAPAEQERQVQSCAPPGLPALRVAEAT